MLVSIEYTARRVNSKHTRYVNIDPEVVDIPADNILELFRFCQTEYGRSVRTIGIDTAQGRKTVGWVFEKRDDSDPTRLMQAWVTMLWGWFPLRQQLKPSLGKVGAFVICMLTFPLLAS